MNDPAQAAQTIANFLQVFTSAGRLRLRYRVKLRASGHASAASADETEPNGSSVPSANGRGELLVEFSGPDTPVLIARNGEVLNALEHLAAKILRLDAEEHDRISFDADHFKANRDREMRESAAAAVERVRASGRPHAFSPMSSRERRALHMLLSESGMPTASSGEGPARFVVLYPEGSDPASGNFGTPLMQRSNPGAVRKAFRHR